MQRLSFRFNVEDENLALNIFRKYVVTIDRKNHWLKYYFKESKYNGNDYQNKNLDYSLSEIVHFK